MEKESKSTYGCCLIELIVFICCVFIFPEQLRDIGKEYLVEETNYIHSTGSDDKCSFIKLAHERGYTISRIKKDDAIRQQKKICKECYPIDEQSSFNKEVLERKEKDIYISDMLKWSPIRLKYDLTDYSELVVYMEHNGVLHLDGDCGWIFGKKKELERVSFGSIKSFKTTCKDCVDNELVEFIYQAVYNGVYDKDLIRDDED